MTRSSVSNRFDDLFELIGDPVVEFELVDTVPVVRAVNPAFSAVFGYQAEEIVGNSLNEYVVPESETDQSELFDRRTSDGKHNTGIVTRVTTDGPREFFYRGLPVSQDGARYGFAIYTDVTDQRRYERHFRVIHRLLRHDLRNSLQVVAGYAEEVTTQAQQPAVAEHGETILEQVRRLLSVGEETRIIEKVLLNDTETAPVDVAAHCRSAVDSYATAYSEASFETDVPETVHVEGIKWVRNAIESLVENAVIHGGVEPTVRVTVRRRQDEVIVDVSDDGPGIPRELRGPVFEDEDITQLRHNRGIGLWLVRWVIEACGGRLGYDRVDGWTTVRLSFQAISRAE